MVRKYSNYEQTIADLSRKFNELDGVNKSLALELDENQRRLIFTTVGQSSNIGE